MKLTRRKLIVAIAASLVSIPWVGKLFYRRPSEFNFERTFTAVVDTLIPADDFPGAVDAGIDKKLYTESQKNGALKTFATAALETLEETAILQNGDSFHALSVSDRTKLLESVFDSTSTNRQTIIVLSHLRNKCMREFYLSPEAFGMLGYHPPSQGGYPDYAKPLSML